MVHVLVKAKILPKSFTHIDGEHNDYKAMLIVHTISLVLAILFQVEEQKIVAFYAISVLIGFALSLTAAIKFSLKSKTYYLLAATPGLVMVIIALAVNMLRIEGIIVAAIAFALAVVLYNRWQAGGKQTINFSH